MTEALALDGGEKVLEIGTGSGYAAAVLSRIAKDVYTVERIGQLAEKAAGVLADLGYGNVHVLHGDGTLGWVDHAPYDAIVVAAGGPEVPESLKRPGGCPIRPPRRRGRLGAATGSRRCRFEASAHRDRIAGATGRDIARDFRFDRRCGSRSAAAAHRQRANRADRRGNARDVRVLPDA
jgi:protein-L-isoaspartate O-methyltransferase